MFSFTPTVMKAKHIKKIFVLRERTINFISTQCSRVGQILDFELMNRKLVNLCLGTGPDR